MQSEGHQDVRLIAVRISSGQLPRWNACAVAAGKGNGQACVCCDKPITVAEVQYDTQLGNARTLLMHKHC